MTQAGSLWVAWVDANVSKGKSVVSLQLSAGSSWNWRKLLKLRLTAAQICSFKCRVGKIWNEIRGR